jgi:UDP-N-acetylglucosamine acyltransferase
VTERVHPTAVVHPDARLGADVEVGPYAVIGAGVVIGDGCRILEHASLRGPLQLGEECVVEHAAALGHDPQVVGNPGPFGGVRIGRRNVFREFAQVQRSMSPDKETVIGDDGYFMNQSHVAHDCVVGDRVTLCNSALLAGHVVVEDQVFVAGAGAVHQFARIGRLAMVAGMAAVPQDVAPFCTVTGMRPARLKGLNVVGLRRSGISAEARSALKVAYRTLFRSDERLEERLAAVDRSTPEVDHLVGFIEASERGVVGFGGRSQAG